MIEHERVVKVRGSIIWLTGPSGSGKTTIAKALKDSFEQDGVEVKVLGSDCTRFKFNADLCPTSEARSRNIRRMAEVASVIADSGIVVIVALISGNAKDRTTAKMLSGSNRFKEVFVTAPAEVCEARDPHNLYKYVKSHEFKNIPGVDAPYEEPSNPDLVVQTHKMGVVECVEAVRDLFSQRAGC